jgi:hypothetical protein
VKQIVIDQAGKIEIGDQKKKIGKQQVSALAVTNEQVKN